MTSPEISVVLGTFNRAADLERTLRAYDRQVDAPPFELVVVDDGSIDATPELLATFRPRNYRLVSARQENAGPARARNRGLALAGGPMVLFTGDDIEPAPTLLERHARHHRGSADPRGAVLGRIAWPTALPATATMRHVDGRGAQQFSYGFMRDGESYDYRHFYTSNVSVARDLLRLEDGPFDEGFPHAAFEDAELAHRLARRGLTIRYHADALAWHWHRYEAPGFFERQKRCGAMAELLVRREPETGPILGLGALQRSRHLSYWVEKLGRGRLAELATRLEEAEARAVAAAATLDGADDEAAFPLLFALFNYGYSAGFADRRWPAATARRVRAAIFARDVEPALAAVPA